MSSPRLSWLVPCTLIVLSGVLTGCDTSFDAFKKTDQIYSVFGYLDANADTQRVRVEALRDTMFVGSDSVGARVTSENLGTGETVVWKERISRVGDNAVPIPSFTTDTDMKLGATYRFRVERKRDGASSVAVVTLPEDSPQVSVSGTLPTKTIGVTVRDVKRLGAVALYMRYAVCGPFNCSSYFETRSWLSKVRRVGEEHFEISLDWYSELQEKHGEEATIIPGRFTLSVASVAEDWPEYRLPVDSLSQAPLPPPDVNSNITGGVGYLGGAAVETMQIPN